jgi:hypothetical protein
MTSPSKKIYYHTIRVSYKRHKRDVYSEEWAVTGHQDPVDIMLYDDKTMSRLRRKFYKNSKAKDKRVTIHEITDTVVLGRENNLDGQKRPDSSGDQ